MQFWRCTVLQENSLTISIGCRRGQTRRGDGNLSKEVRKLSCRTVFLIFLTHLANSIHNSSTSGVQRFVVTRYTANIFKMVPSMATVALFSDVPSTPFLYEVVA